MVYASFHYAFFDALTSFISPITMLRRHEAMPALPPFSPLHAISDDDDLRH